MRYDEEYMICWRQYPSKGEHDLRVKKLVKGENQMEKSDLKTGMVITLESGARGRILLQTNRGDVVKYLNHHLGWDILSLWDDSLKCVGISGSVMDVVKIEVPDNPISCEFTTIWTRSEEPPVVHTLRLDDDAPVELSVGDRALVEILLRELGVKSGDKS